MPSMGIYSYELYKFYNVEKIIRIGSCGGYKDSLKMLDVILAKNAYSESNFAYTMSNITEKIMEPSLKLTNEIEEKAKELNIDIIKGTIMTNDCFDPYVENMKNVLERVPKNIDIIAAEMEAFSLFHIAKILNKEAACIATVVDLPEKKEQVDSKTREQSLNKMITLALEAI